MTVRYRTPYVLGFGLILGGLLLLAYSQMSTVLPDPQRAELADLEGGDVVSEGAALFFTALLITAGLLLILAYASPAPVFPRTAALLIVGVTLPIFLIFQNLLLINGFSGIVADQGWKSFSVSYFFHTGGDLSFAVVYILFFLTLLLVFLLLGAVGYLLAPHRFLRAVLDRMSWAKNEAVHIAATVFLLLSVAVLFFYLLRLAAETDVDQLRTMGFLAQNKLVFYYLLCLLLFGLFLTVAAHAFLLNWGNQTPLEFPRLIDNLRTIRRVERGLLGAAALVNFLILLGPQLPTQLEFSRSFVFGFSPRGFSYAFYLLLLPYVPYLVSQTRLEFLLRAGRGPAGTVFAERSLRLVLVDVLGLVLLTVTGIAAGWDPLGLVLTYSAWTAGVLLFHAVRFEGARGLPRLAFRGEEGPPLYFVFLGLAVTTGLMLWGAGNTFEVAYFRSGATTSLNFVNDASYGQDIFSRFAAAVLIVACLVLTLDLWLHAYHVKRRFLVHYLAVLVLATVAALFTFTVGVWKGGPAGLEEAHAGYAFREFGTGEEISTGVLLVATAIYLFYAFGKMLRPILEQARASRQT